MTLAPFAKVVCLGSGPDGNTFIEIHWQDRNGGMELSLSGVEGPKANGDARGSCGQIVGHITVDRYAPDWNHSKVARLVEVWERWHLNRMRAGTPAQQEFLAAHKADFPGYPISHYDWAKAALAMAGLEPDGDYHYGRAWLAEEVPDEIVQWLFDLPDTHITYPWRLMS